MGITEVQELTREHVSVLYDIVGDASGRFFASDEFNHRLIRLGDGMKGWGVHGCEPGQFHYPCGLARVGQALYVADAWNHRIQVFDLEGQFVKSFGSFGSALDQFQVPLDVKQGSDGLLYVLDSGNNRILVVEPTSCQTVAFFDSRGFHDLVSQAVRPMELALNAPFQLLLAQDMIFVLEPCRIVRIDRQAVHVLPFGESLARQRMLVATATEVLCFDAHRHCVNRCSFSEARCTAHAHLSPGVVDLFVDQDTVMALGADMLPVAVTTVAALWARSMARTAAVFMADVPSGRDLSEPDSMEALTAEILVSGDLSAFCGHYQNLGPNSCLMGKNPLAVWNLTTHVRLAKEYLSLQGRECAEQLEACMHAYDQRQCAVLSRLWRLCNALDPEQRQALWLAQARQYVVLFGELASRRLMAIEQLGRLEFASLAEECEAVQQLNVRLYHLERMAFFGFKLVQQFKSMLLWFDPQGQFAARFLEGLLIVASPKNFAQWAPHLVKFLDPLAPTYLGIGSCPVQAFERARWAIERAVWHDICRRVDPTAAVPHLFLTYGVFAGELQLFRAQGQLYKSYGMNYILNNYMLFLGMTGRQAKAFCEKLKASQLWALPEVRYGCACYLALSANLAPGILLFHEAIDQFRALQDTGNRLYVSAVNNCATNLALAGDLDRAWALLDDFKGQLEYQSTRVNILLAQGDFVGAREMAFSASGDDWPLLFSRAMIHLCFAEWDEAIHLFAQSASQFPEQIARLCLGICYRTAHRFEEAEAYFEQLEPEALPTLPFQKGILFRMMGRDHEALAQFARQTTLMPFRFNQLQILVTQLKLAQERRDLPLSPDLADLWLSLAGRRVPASDPAFLEAVETHLGAERAVLRTDADDVARRAHYAWLETLVNQSMFLMYQSPRP